jgi:hypothetical protein
MVTALFWVITQRPVVIPYRRFRISYPIGCPEKAVRNYHYSLRNDPEERGSQVEPSVKSQTVAWE